MIRSDEYHLLAAIELARLSRESSSHPFDAVLVDAAGEGREVHRGFWR